MPRVAHVGRLAIRAAQHAAAFHVKGDVPHFGAGLSAPQDGHAQVGFGVEADFILAVRRLRRVGGGGKAAGETGRKEDQEFFHGGCLLGDYGDFGDCGDDSPTIS